MLTEFHNRVFCLRDIHVKQKQKGTRLPFFELSATHSQLFSYNICACHCLFCSSLLSCIPRRCQCLRLRCITSEFHRNPFGGSRVVSCIRTDGRNEFNRLFEGMRTQPYAEVTSARPSVTWHYPLNRGIAYSREKRQLPSCLSVRQHVSAWLPLDEFD